MSSSNVLVATYKAYVIFKIPEGLDLSDSSIESYAMRKSILSVKYKDGTFKWYELEEIATPEVDYYSPDMVEEDKVENWERIILEECQEE